jgi:hypothetical protein
MEVYNFFVFIKPTDNEHRAKSIVKSNVDYIHLVSAIITNRIINASISKKLIQVRQQSPKNLSSLCLSRQAQQRRF